VRDLDGVLAGLIALRDEPREDAAPRSRSSRRWASARHADRRQCRTGAAIAASARHRGRKAELMPEDKVAAIGLAARGAGVMVGDGINDAPALAAGRCIGIAMGSAPMSRWKPPTAPC
jgi:Cd2+/Zn2+-exporting ATPase